MGSRIFLDRFSSWDRETPKLMLMPRARHHGKMARKKVFERSPVPLVKDTSSLEVSQSDSALAELGLTRGAKP